MTPTQLLEVFETPISPLLKKVLSVTILLSSSGIPCKVVAFIFAILKGMVKNHSTIQQYIACTVETERLRWSSG